MQHQRALTIMQTTLPQQVPETTRNALDHILAMTKDDPAFAHCETFSHYVEVMIDVIKLAE